VSWQPVDCHAHTTHSDGELDVATLAARARELGVIPSVADHVTHDITAGLRSVAEAERYIEDLERHEVLPAGEFCWHDSLWRELPASLVRRLSHRVGSLHGVFLPGGRLVHMFSRWSPGEMSLGEYMDSHLSSLERFAREMPVDILAHPTLLPVALRSLPLEEVWTEPFEERAVIALREAAIAFEISNRYRPHERFVRRAVAAGVRVSLGSDGHSLEQVADIAWPLELARDLGVREADIYDPRVHGSRTGFHETQTAKSSWGW
jgi:histidinol phosphatase-like PHP family hydrolase